MLTCRLAMGGLLLLCGCERVQHALFPVEGSRPPGSAETAKGARYVGRFDASGSGPVALSWSGSGLVLRLQGTAARATLQGGRYYTVVVDGQVQAEPLTVSDQGGTYDLATGLAPGEHRIQVYRRTSAGLGPTLVGGVEVDGVLLQVPEPARRIELVGDSWSTGYGVEGPDAACRYSPETENHYLSWGAVAARAVDAELSTVALNGTGVLRNEDGSTDDLMPSLYGRVIATRAGSSGTIPPADAVFVAVGSNDLQQGQLPDGFVSAYAALLEQVRAQHPDALIACVLPRLPSAAETTLLHSEIRAAIAERVAAGEARIQTADVELKELIDHGCDHHPGRRTHARMGDKAAAFLRSELGW